MGQEALSDEARIRRGRRLRREANFLSNFRGVAGICMGFYVGLSGDYHQWWYAPAVGGVAYTDRLDGKKGRESDELLEVPPDPKNGMRDNLADKAMTQGFLVGKTVHHLLHREWPGAVVFGSSSIFQGLRDFFATKKRLKAMKFSAEHPYLEPISVGALTLAKAKTAGQLIDQIVDATPLGATPIGKAAVMAGQMVVDVLSGISYDMLTSRIDEQMADRQAILARNALDGTTQGHCEDSNQSL